MSCLEINCNVLAVLRKEYASDVREDRIPILSSFEICANASMTELKKSPPDPCDTDMFKNEAAVFLIFFEVCGSINMTESEFCPPDPWVTDPIKNEAAGFLI